MLLCSAEKYNSEVLYHRSPSLKERLMKTVKNKFQLLTLIMGVLIGTLLMFVPGCSFGKVTESIERTPVESKSKGEGRYNYYVVVKGRDGRVHMYPVQVPTPTFDDPKPKPPEPKKKNVCDWLGGN